jgi:hypothetical protein
MRRLLGLSLMVLLTSLGSAAGTTWHVKADGSGDVATIAAAVAAAAAGDTVMLADGTYAGNGNRDIEISKSITVRSENSYAGTCIIDCDGTSSSLHYGFDITFVGSPGPVIEGMTIREGYWGAGGAIHVYPSGPGSCSPTISNCWFTSNHATSTGGAIFAYAGASPTLITCFFNMNSSDSQGGTLYFDSGSSCTATACFVTLSYAVNSGGAVLVRNATADFVACTLWENTAGVSGGGLSAVNSDLSIVNCSFRDNEVTDGGGGGIWLDGGTCGMSFCVSARNHCAAGAAVYLTGDADVTITRLTSVGDSLTAAADGIITCAASGVSLALDHSIIAFGKGAYGVNCYALPVTPTVTCCDIYGNEAGNWANCIAAKNGVGGNFSADPLFCDIPTDDVSLEDCSPCLAANNTCGADMGALGSGCACGEATEPTTWGAIKAMYKK